MSVVSLLRASTWEVGSWVEGCCEEGVERRVFKMKINHLQKLQNEFKSLEKAYNVFSDSPLAKPILLPFFLRAKSRKTWDKKCYLVGPLLCSSCVASSQTMKPIIIMKESGWVETLASFAVVSNSCNLAKYACNKCDALIVFENSPTWSRILRLRLC